MNVGGNYNRTARPFPGSGVHVASMPPPQAPQPVNIGGYTPVGGYGGGGGGYGQPQYGQQQFGGPPSPGYGGGYGQQQNK